MKNSQIKIKLLTLVALLLSASFIPVNVSAAATYKEKVNYDRVIPPQPTSTKDKVEVVELFWYGCPHCNKLEPYVNRWLKKKPANVEFVRIPAIFRPQWELHARAYYTAVVLGVTEKTHSAMFDAIHGAKRKLDNENALMEFFAEFGVTNKDFKKVFRSFAVETKVRRAKDMTKRYGIRGVPALIVNGKFRTGSKLARGNANIFKVVDHLVEKESKK